MFRTIWEFALSEDPQIAQMQSADCAKKPTQSENLYFNLAIAHTYRIMTIIEPVTVYINKA